VAIFETCIVTLAIKITLSNEVKWTLYIRIVLLSDLIKNADV